MSYSDYDHESWYSADMSNTDFHRARRAKIFMRDLQRKKMPKKCPMCGAPKSNVGHLKHYGYYTGYTCRTFYLDGDKSPFRQSETCKINSLILKVVGRDV